MPGTIETYVPGPLSGATINTDGQLQLLPAAPSQLMVLEAPPIPLGSHNIFTGALDPSGRQLDFAAGIMVLAVAGVKLQEATGEISLGRPVEISLEAAMANPDLIIPMIRTAPLTEFHELIASADVMGFHKRFAEYYNNGDPKPGLWESLKLTDQEIAIARAFGFANKFRALHDSRTQIKSMREADEANIGSVGQTNGFKVDQRVLNYIFGVDSGFVQANLLLEHGDNSIAGSPMTRERLERLMAVRFAIALRSGQATRTPAELGIDVTMALFGRTSPEQEASIDDRNLIKLFGIRNSLTALWAEYGRWSDELRTVDPDNFHDVPVPREIVEMEALQAALEAEIILRMPSQSARQAGMIKLVSVVAGMEVIQGGHKPDHGTEGKEDLLRLDLPGYNQAQFESDIMIAGTVWKIIKGLRRNQELALFERSVAGGIKEKLAQRAGQAAGSIAVGAVLPKSGLAVARDHYERTAAEALSRIGLEAPSGYIGDDLQGWYRHLLASTAGRMTDDAGRYGGVYSQLMEEFGREQRMEDFPGSGRMFNFYGDCRPEDGALGLLEAIAAANGVFQFIESAGNGQFNPMSDKAIRTDLQNIAKKFGFKLQVIKPFDIIPSGYLSEAANFIGRMPAHFTPGHIFSLLVPNGYATLSIASNRALVRKIKEEGASIARFSEEPSDIVRFFRDAHGKLDFTLGHNHPDWKWPDKTLIIYRNKDEKGTPNDLYQAFSRQAKRVA